MLGKDVQLQAIIDGKDDNIKFKVITWEDVFSTLDAVCRENSIESFLLEELRRYTLISPEILQDEKEVREKWADVIDIADAVKKLADTNRVHFSFTQFYESQGERKEFYSCFITDNASGLRYLFSAYIPARRFLAELDKQSLFVLQVCFDKNRNVFPNKPFGKAIIKPEILKNCGFEYIEPSTNNKWACEYVYLLTDSYGHKVDVDVLAKKLAAKLQEVSEAIDAAKKQNP